ncbi:hypothetical protein QR680_012011 [Steinernema hermaphroditum]|uniref:Uncharacterized protein n=1 Tax=Steinernema hermaphroditum TaxID=289476 RepID=A0AA39I0L2_9BILA|nr:hypothetical protein QR680_012011 [Steinernema hermaphroditum]
MTVMSDYPYHNNPSTPENTPKRNPKRQIPGAPPPFPPASGSSYYSYQQFQQQQQQNRPPQQWSQPDPDAYNPQGVSNYNQTANWVHGNMYSSSAALPSYHGSAAPSVVSNLSYNGRDVDDNMSTISTMTGYGGGYSSRASTCSNHPNENIDPSRTLDFVSELIQMVDDVDAQIRSRAMNNFLQLMQKKIAGQSCLVSLPEDVRMKLFSVLVECVRKRTQQGDEKEVSILMQILQYIGTLTDFIKVFDQLTQDTRGAAMHTVFNAIVLSKPGMIRDRMEQNKLIHIFFFIHSALEASEHCKKCLRHIQVVRRFLDVLGAVLASPGDMRYTFRLQRVIYTCVSMVVGPKEDLVKEVVNRGIIEYFLKSLEAAGDALRNGAQGQGARVQYFLSAVLKHLYELLKASKKVVRDRASFNDDVCRRFLGNDGFRKVAKHINSVNPKTSEYALLCLCYTAHRQELKNQDLREPVRLLLSFVNQLIADRRSVQFDPVQIHAKKITGILNKVLSPLACISQIKSVKEQLSLASITNTCLSCIEQEQKMNNADGIESCLIILNNLCNATNNQYCSQVQTELLRSKNGPVVLLDQLSYGEFVNKKMVMKILSRQKEENLDHLVTTISSDSQWNYASALYYGIDKFGSDVERCSHSEHKDSKCPQFDEFLKMAFNFLRTLCTTSLEFASDFATNYLGKNPSKNIILQLCRCKNEALTIAIVDFTKAIGSREPGIFVDLRNSMEFETCLEAYARTPNELGAKCAELLGMLKDYSARFSEDISSAIGYSGYD